jgi:anti-sigma B factor antagonist
MSRAAQSRRTSEPRPDVPLSCFRLDPAGGPARLVLVGELDLATAPLAREAIGHAQRETRELILDLGDVWLVDLSGLRVLLDAAVRARRTGRPLTIANCPPLVPRMLHLLGLSGALDIQSDVRAA